MKTHLNISEPLMRRVKADAARRGITASALIESALRRYLEETPRDEDLGPLPTLHGGSPIVDVADRHVLYEEMGDW